VIWLPHPPKRPKEIAVTNFIESTDAAPDISTGYTITAGDAFYGTLDPLTSDWVRVTITASGTYSVGVVGIGAKGSGLSDPTLILHDAAGNTLAINDNSGPGQFPSYTVTVDPGTYYVEVANLSGSTADAAYGLVVTEGDKPSFGVDMGAAILYRPGVSWSDGPGSAATVTWGVRSEGLTTDAQGNPAPFYQLTAAQIAAVETALANYADVGNLTFVQQNPGGNSNTATMEMGAYQSTQDGAGAFAYYPDKTGAKAVSGDLWLNNEYVSRTDLPFGTYSYFAIMHELGHAMGLAHPGDYNAAPGVSITYDNSAQFVQDSRQYTVMSYFKAAATEPDAPKTYADTLMMYDIYAIQQLYGVNHATRAGDDTYGFNSTVGGAYDFTTNTDPFLCIWDGGGTDTLDLSGFKRAQMITLIDGQFSNVAGFVGNLSIAIGAVIENAIGGGRGDDITGNDADNLLKGGRGDDTLAGGAGDDLLIGNKGADTFVFEGGMGSDTVQGFNLTEDHLSLTADLWGGAVLTAADVISTYGQVVGHSFVLDFGSDEITLAGLGSAAGLESQIIFA